MGLAGLVLIEIQSHKIIEKNFHCDVNRKFSFAYRISSSLSLANELCGVLCVCAGDSYTVHVCICAFNYFVGGRMLEW